MLAVTMRMREGELLALKRAGIDPDGAKRADGPSLYVRATLECTREGSRFEEPQAARPRRVDLTAAVAALRQQRIAQHAERLTLGEARRGLDLVFPSEEGTPITLSNLLRRSFRPLLARAGCPRVRFHDLRHTIATLLPEQGINVKYSAETLGHAGIAVTLDLDGPATPTM